MDGPGVACGATIEFFATSDDAAARARHVDSLMQAGLAASEYDTVNATALLRVSGVLTPDQAGQYKSAFMGR